MSNIMQINELEFVLLSAVGPTQFSFIETLTRADDALDFKNGAISRYDVAIASGFLARLVA